MVLIYMLMNTCKHSDVISLINTDKWAVDDFITGGLNAYFEWKNGQTIWTPKYFISLSG